MKCPIAIDYDKMESLKIAADWYEDNGNTVASEGLRWRFNNNKRPYLTKSLAMWFNEDAVQGLDLGDPESDLPQAVYRLLLGHTVSNHKVYQSAEQAEQDFVEAWVKAVSEGFKPNTGEKRE